MNAIIRFTRRIHPRHGSVLVEFAIVAFLLYFIIAAIFTFGHALYITESLQHTTDLFAHELAHTPLPPEDALSDALADPTVTSTLYDQQYLEIDLTPWLTGSTNLTVDQWLQSQGVPMINRLLAPLMILDLRSDGHTYLWYPGAVKDSNGNYYVSILTTDGVVSGPTTYPVIEAVSNPDTFPLGAPNTNSPGTVQGMCGIRINYPYQSAFMSSYTYSVDGLFVTSPNGQTDQVTNTAVTTNNEQPDFSPTRGGLYGGPDKLGQQYAGGQMVRPFQRLISAQAVYRRDVYSAPTTTPTTGP